jgi:hypothetical protein
MSRHAIKSNSNRISLLRQSIPAPVVNIDQVMIDGMMSSTIGTLEDEITAKEAEIATKTAEIASLTSDLATAQAAYDALLASNTATVEQLTLAQAQVQTLQGQITVLQSDLATANATILDLQDQLANSGGGVSLEPYIGDLNDASWTYFPGQTSGVGAKPEADFLDSYAYDSGTKIHSFTTKSIAVGDEAYAINTGATYIGPRWYKPATYADGTPVMRGDSFSLSVRIDNFTRAPTTMNGYLFALDLFEWPYINDANNKFYLNYQRSVGFCAICSGGSIGFGTHVSNTTVVNTSTKTSLEGVGTVVLPGGTRNSSRPSWIIYFNDGFEVRNVTLNTVYQTASSEVGQLYLGLLVSANGTAATTGGTANMRLSYSIGKLQ